MKLRMKDINPHIVCPLCAGYFVDATTITECLHTFCKSCIVKYLQSTKFCPTCNTKVHETQPLLNIKPDRLMQDIVHKIVPGLAERESKRKREFYARQLSTPAKPLILRQETITKKVHRSLLSSTLPYRGIALVLCLSKSETQLNQVSKQYVNSPGHAMVLHVKRLLKLKGVGVSQPSMLVLCCNNQKLEDHMTMVEVYMKVWQPKAGPVYLEYYMSTEGNISS